MLSHFWSSKEQESRHAFYGDEIEHQHHPGFVESVIGLIFPMENPP
jgi:uncharacterized membrane protein